MSQTVSDPSRWLAINFPERLALASLSRGPLSAETLRAILKEERAFWQNPCPLNEVPGASFVAAELAHRALESLDEEWAGVDSLECALQAQEAGDWRRAVRFYMRTMHSLSEALYSWTCAYDQASFTTAFHVQGGIQQKLGEHDPSWQPVFSALQMQAICQVLFRIHQQFSRVGSLILELSLRLTYCQSQAMQEAEMNGAPALLSDHTAGASKPNR